MANAKIYLNGAVNATDNCGLSGSSDEISNVAENNGNAAKELSGLNTAFINVMDDNGELTGDLGQVTDAFTKCSSVVDSLSGAIKTLAEKLESEEYSGLENVASTLRQMTKSLTDLTETFNKVNGPEQLFADINDPLNNFNDALQELYDAVAKLNKSLSSLLRDCKYSMDVPNALEDLNGALKKFISDLSEKLQQ